MAVTSAASGSQTATLNTNHTLTTVTTAGVYQLVVDTALLVNGETLILTLNTKCRTGDTSRIAFRGVYRHAQGDPNKYSPALMIDAEIVAILRQEGGTGRAFPWNLLKG